MKKKYIYMLVPTCGVILFSLFYIPFSNRLRGDAGGQKHKQEQIDRKEKAEKEAESPAPSQHRGERHAAKSRKAEREAKAAREKAEQDALSAADAARVKAHNDKQKYEQEVTDLKKTNQARASRPRRAPDQQAGDALKEQDFLKAYIQQAEANRQNILGLLDKLTTAEKARADEAAKAAAATQSS